MVINSVLKHYNQFTTVVGKMQNSKTCGMEGGSMWGVGKTGRGIEHISLRTHIQNLQYNIVCDFLRFRVDGVGSY